MLKIFRVVLGVLCCALGCGCTASDHGSAADSKPGIERAALTPSVGPEFELDAPVPVTGLQGLGPRGAAANAAGTTLVVWVAGNSSFATAAELYGARVAADGTVLDPNGFRIGPARVRNSSGHLASVAAVASDGSGWLVAWSDVRDGNTANVRGARVDAAGHVLDPDTFLISGDLPDAYSAVAMAWGGTDWLVTWTENGTQGRVTGARVSTAGAVEDPGGFAIASFTSFSVGGPTGVSVAHDGSAWLVAWSDYHSQPDPLTTRVPAYDAVAARVKSPTDISTSFTVAGGARWQQGVNVACGGSTCLFAWLDLDPATGTAAVYVRRYAGVLDSPLVIFSAASYPVVAFDGTNFTVAISNSAAHVTPAGVLADAVSGIPTGIAAGNGAATLLAFAGQLGQVDAKLWGAAGTVSSEFGIGSLYGVEHRPAVAASSSAWLAVWLDNRNGTVGPNGIPGDLDDIYGVRIDANGAALDASPIAIAVGSGVKSNPRVVSDGSGWLVVWDEGRSVGNVGDSFDAVYGTRVSAAGVVLDPGGFVIDGATNFSRTNAGLGFDGQDFLVDWSEYNGCFGARVSTAGQVLDPGRITLPLCGAIGSGRGRWFVAGVDFQDVTYPVKGYRVGAAGTVLDPEPMSLGGSNAGLVLVAAGATAWLTAWTDALGARVSDAGSLLDTTPLAMPPVLAPTSALPASTSSTHNGTDWLFVWARGAQANWRPPYDLDGGRVKNDGTLLDQSGFAIVTAPADGSIAYSGPVVAGGPGGRELVVYTRSVGPFNRLSARVLASDCVATSTTDTTCDGVDDDCNGVADDGCIQSGSGGSAGASGIGGVTGASGGMSASGGISAGGGMSASGGEPDGAAGENNAGGAELGGAAGESTGGTSSGATGGTANGGRTTANGGRTGGGGRAMGGTAAIDGIGGATASGGERSGSSGKGGRGASGAAGKTGGGRAGGSGQPGAGGSTPPADSGCGCSVPRSSTQPPALASVLLLAAAYGARRRRAAREQLA